MARYKKWKTVRSELIGIHWGQAGHPFFWAHYRTEQERKTPLGIDTRTIYESGATVRPEDIGLADMFRVYAVAARVIEDAAVKAGKR